MRCWPIVWGDVVHTPNTCTAVSDMDRDDDQVSEVFKLHLGNNLPAQARGRLVTRQYPTLYIQYTQCFSCASAADC